jgi:hypothetical protein
MQTIVVFARRLKVGVLVRNVAGSPIVKSLQQRGEPGAPQAKFGTKESASHKELTPPFWTWFIENPRGDGAT